MELTRLPPPSCPTSDNNVIDDLYAISDAYAAELHAVNHFAWHLKRGCAETAPTAASTANEISLRKSHIAKGLELLPFLRPFFRANKNLLTNVSASHCTPNTRPVTIRRNASPASRVAGNGFRYRIPAYCSSGEHRSHQQTPKSFVTSSKSLSPVHAP
jgi:hypothetical protein